jgi:uncharacterized membrane protein YfcA
MNFLEVFPIVVLAFVCELIDSTLGMGYGTTLTPIMLVLGYEPLQIVPAVLCSESITGVLAGVLHQEYGNVDLRPGSRDNKVCLLLTVCSLGGVLISTILAINLPSWIVKLYIGILVLSLGIYILTRKGEQHTFSWWRIGGLGTF